MKIRYTFCPAALLLLLLFPAILGAELGAGVHTAYLRLESGFSFAGFEDINSGISGIETQLKNDFPGMVTSLGLQPLNFQIPILLQWGIRPFKGKFGERIILTLRSGYMVARSWNSVRLTDHTRTYDFGCDIVPLMPGLEFVIFNSPLAGAPLQLAAGVEGGLYWGRYFYKYDEAPATTGENLAAYPKSYTGFGPALNLHLSADWRLSGGFGIIGRLYWGFGGISKLSGKITLQDGSSADETLFLQNNAFVSAVTAPSGAERAGIDLNGFGFTLGVQFYFGGDPLARKLELSGASVAVRSDTAWFSPGSTVAINSARFVSYISKKEGLKLVSLQIQDRNGNTVHSRSATNYFASYTWEGSGKNSTRLPDGKYTYLLKAEYINGTELKSKTGAINIDTVTPAVSVTAQTDIFSPNGDRRQDILPLVQQATGESEDTYTGEICSTAGNPVKKFHWQGAVTNRLAWDGRKDDGDPAPEGHYFYRLTSLDKARNSARVKTRPFLLVRNPEPVTLSSDSLLLTPNSDGRNEAVKFSMQTGKALYLRETTLTVRDSSNRIVFKRTGNGLLPVAAWSGRSNSKPLPEGDYHAELTSSFRSGNLVTNRIRQIRLDGTPPRGIMVVKPKLFTPDGDGDADRLFIKLKIDDCSDIAGWKIAIYKKTPAGPAKTPIKTFIGKSKTASLEWDGKSDDGKDFVDAVQDYTAVLETADIHGNRMTPVTAPVTVGVLVEKTPDGLRIRVSSIQFGFDSARMVGDSEKNLDKVLHIIRMILADPKKYGISAGYKIVISGHTDTVGNPAYNKQLSAMRAKTVYDYFLGKGVDKNRLEYIGYGMSKPFKKIEAGMLRLQVMDFHSRNRRVEFFIRK